MDSIVNKKLQKMLGFGLLFVGGFFILIGILFGTLFEESGLYIFAIFGVTVILIGIIVIRRVKNVSIIDLNLNPTKKKNTCTRCGRFVPSDANLCPYCGERYKNALTCTSSYNVLINSTDPQKQDRICKNCGSSIQLDEKYCQYCGSVQ